MGGAIAAQFARKNADDVRSVTLISTHICGYRGFEGWPNLPRIAKDRGLDSARNAWKEFRLFEPIKSDAGKWDKLSRMIDGFSCAPWIDPNPHCNDEDDYSHAEDISAPTLLLTGSFDIDFLPISEYLSTTLPNCRIRHFECGHLVNLELPDQVNEAIADFYGEPL
jgi:pimeloyl-ACP methyl ester carboxylesterase